MPHMFYGLFGKRNAMVTFIFRFDLRKRQGHVKWGQLLKFKFSCKTYLSCKVSLRIQEPDLFHALECFIFKRRFWQNTTCYGTSEYCAWFSMLWCLTQQFFFSVMEWFEPHENKTRTLSDPGSRVPESWQNLWHFSRHFGEVKNRIESGVKRRYQHNGLQHK